MKKYLPAFAVILALLFLVALTGCGQSNAPEKRHGKLKVLTTFAPLYSFALNVAGSRADVQNLVPTGTSIHNFSARPSDVKKIAKADVLIINGVGLETFLSGMIDAAANPRLKIVDTSRRIQVFDSQDIDERSGDPHIWLSPKNAVKQVETIRDALAIADPQNAKAYQKNAAAYIKKLKALDAEIAASLAKTRKKRFIVFHNAYQYFEHDYGLKNAGAIEEFPGKEPGPRYIKELIALIKKGHVGIIFAEPQFSPKLVNTLKQELGVYVGVLDPVGSELSREGYEKNLKNNLRSLELAFSEGHGK
jgi:ABC-type Zn uptake system ZnuABC Zn-binding protein ZnuA